MTRKRCLVNRCVIWDDERDTCALTPANIYNKMREAVTDAAVDVAQGDLFRRCAPPFPEWDGLGGDGLHG